MYTIQSAVNLWKYSKEREKLSRILLLDMTSVAGGNCLVSED